MTVSRTYSPSMRRNAYLSALRPCIVLRCREVSSTPGGELRFNGVCRALRVSQSQLPARESPLLKPARLGLSSTQQCMQVVDDVHVESFVQPVSQSDKRQEDIGPELEKSRSKGRATF